MSGKQLMGLVMRRHPGLRELPGRQLRVVRAALSDAISISSRSVLSPEESDRMFRRLVPDSGQPSAALRAYRKRMCLTQKELSRKTGVPQPHLSSMESGRRPIGLKMAKKLALAIGVDFRKLI